MALVMMEPRITAAIPGGAGLYSGWFAAVVFFRRAHKFTAGWNLY
jgi:hypothetical protein